MGGGMVVVVVSGIVVVVEVVDVVGGVVVVVVGGEVVVVVELVDVVVGVLVVVVGIVVVVEVGGVVVVVVAGRVVVVVELVEVVVVVELVVDESGSTRVSSSAGRPVSASRALYLAPFDDSGSSPKQYVPSPGMAAVTSKCATPPGCTAPARPSSGPSIFGRVFQVTVSSFHLQLLMLRRRPPFSDPATLSVAACKCNTALAIRSAPSPLTRTRRNACCSGRAST